LNRNQKIIVVAGVALAVCIAGALLLRNQYGALARNDVLGMVPGMTRDQVEKLITARRWVCAATAAGDAIDCNTNAGALTIGFAPGTGATAVLSARVVLANPDKLSFDATAQEISAQYGRKPAQQSAQRIVWPMAGTMTLVLTQGQTGGFALTLSDDPAQAAPAPPR
jgi:hypothetical protein